uniref:Uncharacterized protein n=1 Tax=Arundo donax TaxID=35708 RepID=A0A0A9DFW4_ARUDO
MHLKYMIHWAEEWLSGHCSFHNARMSKPHSVKPAP